MPAAGGSADLLQHRDCPDLQNVDDAKVEHRILWAPGVLRVQGHSCGCHVHAQVHPRLPQRVGQLVCGAVTEGQRPAGDQDGWLLVMLG